MSSLKFVFLAAFIGLGWQAAAAPAAVSASPPGPLLWEPTNQTYSAKAGDISAHFTFKVCNLADSEVVIDDVKTSCGCTVAQFPTKPWRLTRHETNHMDVLVDLRGKHGTLFKQIAILSSNAPSTLTLVIDVPNDGGTNSMSPEMAERIWRQQLSATDHQAVFKNDCVRCHLVPAFGKYDQQLYAIACGICHEGKRRATMVPDLRVLKTEVDTNYWENWVTYGKPGTLMPGFAAKLGGPLDDDQIKSLVQYLTRTFPRPLKPAVDPDEAND